MRPLYLLCTCLSLLLSASTHAQVPSYLDTTGLVAFYGFNGNTNDGYIYANHGANTGATFTADRSGNPNTACHFDGSTSSISVPSSASLSNFPAGQTIAMWVQINAFPTDNKEHYLIWKQNAAPLSYYHLFVSNLNAENKFVYRYAQSAANTAYGTIPFISFPVAQWVHYAVTTDLSHTYTYINGAQTGDSLNTQAATFGVNTNPLLIGTNGDLDPTRTKFSGDLDELAIYKRALSKCDVLKLSLSTRSFLTQHPVTDSVLAGANAQYTVFTAGNGSNWNYQWQFDAGSGFADLSNSAVYSGVFTNMLHITNASITMNNYQYRCVISSSSGCSENSNAARLIVKSTGVEQINLKDNITLSPNPAGNTIRIKAPFRVKKVEVINLTGQVIQNIESGTNIETVSVSGLPLGIYLVRINSEFLRKIIKE